MLPAAGTPVPRLLGADLALDVLRPDDPVIVLALDLLLPPPARLPGLAASAGSTKRTAVRAVSMRPDQARDLARHLLAAVEFLEGQGGAN